MKLGIKTGLKNNWKNDIQTVQPDFCELWFNSTKIKEYVPMLDYLKRNNIGIGLHFWGSLPDGTLTNIAYPDSDVLAQSKNLIKKTIDIGSRYNTLYINLHPTGTVITKVDFDKELFKPYSQKIALNTSLTILEQSLSELTDYAFQKGTILTIESTPKMALGQNWHGKESRLNPVNIGEFTVSEVEPLFKQFTNLYFANDFGHSSANFIDKDRNVIVRELFNIARRLVNITRLLHISYIVPPYNGTDYHGCLYNEEFNTDAAIPNYMEMLELLKLFVNREDVYALVEPESDHVGNFYTLKKLVDQVS